MSGRPKIKLYHYDTKENGYKFLGIFESQVEVFHMYYPSGGKGKLFTSNPEYRELPDGTYVTKERAGRNVIPNLVRKYTDPLNWKKDGDKVIELFNDLGEKIGEVANHRVLEALTKCSIGALKFHLVTTTNVKRASFGVPLCRFKKEESDYMNYEALKNKMDSFFKTATPEDIEEDMEYLDEIERMSSNWASGKGYI